MLYDAKAQMIQVSALPDTGVIRIGEQTHIRLQVSCPKGKNILWPVLADTLIKGLQITNRSKTDTIKSDTLRHSSEIRLEQNITLTSFDSGYYAIPPFRFYPGGDTTHPLLTEAILLRVVGMKVDTTQAIKDIKQPVDAPFDWHELIPMIKWVLAGVAVLLVIIMFLRYFIKKKKVSPEPVKIQEPAHLLALRNLEKLRDQKLWQEGKLKEYQSTLTDILRLYIEQRYGICAMEQTSEEILSSLRSLPLGEENRSRLKQIFFLADLVKFAKQNALPGENEMSMENAMAFIRATIPDPEAPPTNNTQTD